MSYNDYEITVEESANKNSHEITFTGELTIENSRPIYNYLMNKVLPLESVRIKINDPTNIDICFIQYIIGIMEARNKTEKSTYVELNIDESLADLLNRTGITEKISSLQKELS